MNNAKIFKGYVCESIPLEKCQYILDYLQCTHNEKFSIMYILHTREPPSPTRRGRIRDPSVATLVSVLAIPHNNISINSNGNITFV